MKKKKSRQKTAFNKLDYLTQISSAIVSNQYLKEILHLIVAITAEMMNSKICSIMLVDPTKKELVIEATQSLSPAYCKKPNLKIGESISGKALESGKPIKVLDVRKSEQYQFPAIAKTEGIVSMLSIPMMVRGATIGVINSYTAQKHNFSDDEIKILQAVANQAAVAIENTKLMEETHAAREALETRKVVERAKGILMKEHNIGEEEAYRLIHRKSMDSRRSMRNIAEAVLVSYDMKKGL